MSLSKHFHSPPVAGVGGGDVARAAPLHPGLTAPAQPGQGPLRERAKICWAECKWVRIAVWCSNVDISPAWTGEAWDHTGDFADNV